MIMDMSWYGYYDGAWSELKWVRLRWKNDNVI